MGRGPGRRRLNPRASMQGWALPLLALCVLGAACGAGAADTVRLCGLDYVRTVVNICATARWRRRVEGAPPAERRNDFQLPNRPEASEENLVHSLAQADFSRGELVPEGQGPVDRLREAGKRRVMSSRDLQTVCCTDGCSMAELSALC